MLAVARVSSILSEARVEFVFAKALLICSTLSLFTQVYIWEGLNGLTDRRRVKRPKI